MTKYNSYMNMDTYILIRDGIYKDIDNRFISQK
jgi:hypothetical protein